MASKILRGPGFRAFILRPMGGRVMDVLELYNFFVDFSWMCAAVASFLRPNIFRGFFVDLRSCGFLSETENSSFFS